MHLKIDTGMQRVGAQPGDVVDVVDAMPRTGRRWCSSACSLTSRWPMNPQMSSPPPSSNVRQRARRSCDRRPGAGEQPTVGARSQLCGSARSSRRTALVRSGGYRGLRHLTRSRCRRAVQRVASGPVIAGPRLARQASVGWEPDLLRASPHLRHRHDGRHGADRVRRRGASAVVRRRRGGVDRRLSMSHRRSGHHGPVDGRRRRPSCRSGRRGGVDRRTRRPDRAERIRAEEWADLLDTIGYEIVWGSGRACDADTLVASSPRCWVVPMLELRAASLADTNAIAASLAELARPGDLIVLSGEMGAGKTAFAKGFGAALGVTEPITSPTFTLVHTYDIPSSHGHGAKALHHADLYRLDRTTEIANLALEELAEYHGIVLVEWGDVADALFGDHLVVYLESDPFADTGDESRPGCVAGHRQTDRDSATGASWASVESARAAVRSLPSFDPRHRDRPRAGQRGRRRAQRRHRPVRGHQRASSRRDTGAGDRVPVAPGHIDLNESAW